MDALVVLWGYVAAMGPAPVAAAVILIVVLAAAILIETKPD